MGVIVCAALLFSWRHLEAVSHIYHALMLVFLAGMVGFCLTGDLFNLFVFFELLSVAAYALVGYKIDQRAPLEGSLNFAITNSVGGFIVLTGVALLYGRTGALNMAQIGESLAHQHTDALVVVALTLLVTGFFVKAAVVPFHFWLADAYSVAPTPVCAVLSAVMSELGLYAVVRIWWSCFLNRADSSWRTAAKPWCSSKAPTISCRAPAGGTKARFTSVSSTRTTGWRSPVSAPRRPPG